MSECRRCGDCCRNNGLIPPVNINEAVPGWLNTLVHALRRDFADVAEDYPCIFLTDENACAIHVHKPAACREFFCDEVSCTFECWVNLYHSCPPSIHTSEEMAILSAAEDNCDQWIRTVHMREVSDE